MNRKMRERCKVKVKKKEIEESEKKEKCIRVWGGKVDKRKVKNE